jgi:hypothetical protein
VTFNMPVSVDSARERLSVRELTAFGLWSTPVEGSLTAQGNDIVFTPSAPLDFNRQYVVTLEPGVTAEVGGLGTDDFVRFRFRSVPVLRILSTSPRDGQTEVDSYEPFVIEFTAPVNEAVIDNISIDPASRRTSGNVSAFRAAVLRRTELTYTTITWIEDPRANK